MEIDRGGMSYTVDTLRQIHTERPDDELFIMLGSDTLRDIGLWREPGEIFRLARPLFVHRAGAPQPEVPASVLKANSDGQVVPQTVEMPTMTESSTEIRALVAAHQSIDDLVPPTVARYIAENGLYR
jgi:nicotinate-nucleotide adenylyltransferase